MVEKTGSQLRTVLLVRRVHWYTMSKQSGVVHDGYTGTL